MYEIAEKIVKQYVVTCSNGEVTFEDGDMAKAFIQLHNHAKPFTREEVDEGIKGTSEQVAAWCVIGSCPNCGATGRDGDLNLENFGGEDFDAECYVCDTKFWIIDGKSEVKE